MLQQCVAVMSYDGYVIVTFHYYTVSMHDLGRLLQELEKCQGFSQCLESGLREHNFS